MADAPQSLGPETTQTDGRVHITVGRQRIALTLQGGTLLVLLGIGQQAKAAFDEQFEQLEQTRVQFEVRSRELTEQVTELRSTMTELAKAVPGKDAEQRIRQLELDVALVHAKLPGASEPRKAVRR